MITILTPKIDDKDWLFDHKRLTSGNNSIQNERNK